VSTAAAALVECAQVQLLHLRLLELLCYLSRVRARCSCCWYFCLASGEAALATTVRAEPTAAAVLVQRVQMLQLLHLRLLKLLCYVSRVRARCGCCWYFGVASGEAALETTVRAAPTAAAALVDRAQVPLPQPRPLGLLGCMPRVRAVATADTVAWFSSRQAWRWTARAAAAAAAVPTVELERPGYYMPRMRARASGGRCCFCVWCG
jgi:hypothetical protein